MDSWRWVWQINGPQTYKTFLWLALWDRLLTNAKRERRGLTNDLLCPIREMEYETIEHTLHSYPEAASVWQWFHIHGMGALDNRKEFKELAKHNILKKDVGDDWAIKFVTVMGYTWKWRMQGVSTAPPQFLLTSQNSWWGASATSTMLWNWTSYRVGRES